ncbi:hypothetical protein G5714_004585 [Onychostoma macrolepis]|uniref:Uncharacterized protein n=1 Tax=Onychostoma macrolepis TaxID=369639 RepID=A0A7J6D581_9TELE|nr:hypothetical protein G5714_004585 [Onychostoma macrolepis]
MVSLRREMRAMIKALRGLVVVHKVEPKAKNSHKPEEQYKISQFMCHDTSTADKFYAVNLNPKQAVENHLLFEQALEGPESSPVKGEAIPKPTKHKWPATTATKETCQDSQPVIFISQ